MGTIGAWHVTETPAEVALYPAHLAGLGPVWSDVAHAPAAAGAMAPGPHEVPASLCSQITCHEGNMDAVQRNLLLLRCCYSRHAQGMLNTPEA